MDTPFPTWRAIDADLIVSQNPCLLHGLVVLASSDGGDVTLYAAQEARTADKIGRFEGANNISNPIMFYPPLPCRGGLYADVGSGITEVLIIYTVLDKNFMFTQP